MFACLPDPKSFQQATKPNGTQGFCLQIFWWFHGIPPSNILDSLPALLAYLQLNSMKKCSTKFMVLPQLRSSTKTIMEFLTSWQIVLQDVASVARPVWCAFQSFWPPATPSWSWLDPHFFVVFGALKRWGDVVKGGALSRPPHCWYGTVH